MARKAYARRYAQAVFEIALEANRLEKWRADLQEIAEMVGHDELVAFLTNVKIPLKERTGVISGQMADLEPLVLNLLYLLISKGRLEMLGDVCNEYNRLYNRHQGIEHAEVLTAVPLSDTELETVTNNLEQIAGKKLLVDTRVDNTLIAGVVARIDGKLLDGSTRNKLNQLKKEIAETAR